MKTAISRLLQRLPRPFLVSAGFLGLGLLSTITAALVPFERFSAREVDPGLMLTLDREFESSELDELTVFFSLPEAAGFATEAADETWSEEIDPENVLRAIAEVESQGNPRRVGRLGERGLYQFRLETWRQHTAVDFRRAHHPEISATVARRHYDWITRELRSRGYQGSPYEVALAWNAGLSRVLSGRVPSRSRHYAQRVANLASDS